MVSGRAAQNCPRCGSLLESILDLTTGNRGVRCWRTSCLFNFLDQNCQQCGGAVAEARRQDIGKFHVKCANQHEWTC